MLRPLLAFLTLCLAAFLLAPTVASVHARVTQMHVDRDTPWEIWKWTDEPDPSIGLPGCDQRTRQLYSEITQWPAKIEKDKGFTLRGVVQSPEEGDIGIALVNVDVFLNATKEEPGEFLGEARTTGGGYFELLAMIPFDLQADHYHIVAHAHTTAVDCTTYREHWSDPETDVVSRTDIRFDPVDHAVAGREQELSGTLVDAVGAPVRGVNMTLTIDGKETKVQTDQAGRFRVPYRPSSEGNFSWSASFEGGSYYLPTKNETAVSVASEALEFGAPGDAGFTLVRSTPTTLTGAAYVADAKATGNVTLTFQGTKVATCLECPASTSLVVPVGDDGAWQAMVVVPPDVAPSRGTVTVTGGGLEEAYTTGYSVLVPTTTTLEAAGTGLFSKGFEARARVVDEAGRPVQGLVALSGPAGDVSNATDASGAVQFAGSGSCGRHSASARYAGDDLVQPSSAQTELLVCGWLAFVPPFLLAVPWYVWPLLLLAAISAWYLTSGLRQTYASTLRSGPPLTLSFTEPADEAAGYAGIGEAVVATAFLEEPLPDGHTLRMGTSRRVEERPLDGELRASLRFVPDKLGDVPIRAEIADPKGRVVSRRTLHLHVVRYAEEIESRYLRLRASSGATDDVTPREFEAWLRARAPGLDAEVARRLVHVFEEADYSPRTAGRADFAAYLSAERGVQEVPADAPLA